MQTWMQLSPGSEGCRGSAEGLPRVCRGSAEGWVSRVAVELESEDSSDDEVQDEEALLSRAVWRNGYA